MAQVRDVTHPYRAPGPLARLAPPTPWNRLAWAWCRGVLYRVANRRRHRTGPPLYGANVCVCRECKWRRSLPSADSLFLPGLANGHPGEAGVEPTWYPTAGRPLREQHPPPLTLPPPGDPAKAPQ